MPDRVSGKGGVKTNCVLPPVRVPEESVGFKARKEQSATTDNPQRHGACDHCPGLCEEVMVLVKRHESGKAKPGVVGAIPDLVQLNRRANLRAILGELLAEGVVTTRAAAQVLQVDPRDLDGMLKGDDIPDAFARDVEWVMHRRAGWMDEDERERDV
ncbi:hypothetical protein KPL74_08565 [Bacillus sp. NP157]|nr:hypothetical protein KPL74_08565 [Bacillus sp. NP157]